MPDITICVWEGNRPRAITAAAGATLSEILRKNGIDIPSPCGGRGVCGKCAVRITKEVPPATTADADFFTETALAAGQRLACGVSAVEGMTVYTKAYDEKSFHALQAYEPLAEWPLDRQTTSPERLTSAQSDPDDDKAYTEDTGQNQYGIAIDIGTTTIAFEILHIKTGKRAAAYAAVNRQRAYGADVITRIQQAGQGKLAALHASVTADIQQGVQHMLTQSGLGPENIAVVYIAGNTTMLHLLANVSCESLGRAPFTPVFTRMKRYSFPALLGVDTLDCETVLLPGISAFVGADITAGLVFCGGLQHKKPCVLIDLGTNGEMVLFSKDRVIATATAAGPAFEAGNISRGTGSIPGAIAKVSYDPPNNVYHYETIGGLPALGICGTGVMDTAAQLAYHGLADETGLLTDFEEGAIIAADADIVFTQKDMREVQLAKSAVRSGLEVLLRAAGCGYNEIDRVYLAGGFGHKMNMESARILGIIPEALCAKVIAVGNSALGGCAQVMLSQAAEQEAVAITAIAEEINLSADPRFNDLFMQHMMF